jgi:DUF1680 family protein
MLKLTRDLFMFNQSGSLMDYYERGLYNHILASVAEHNAGNTYHVPLRPGSVKGFGNPNMNSIYFRSEDNKALYVNLYIPSILRWDDMNVSVSQTTAYPKEDQTLLTINGKGKFEINVRVPHWATEGFFVKINGKSKKVNAVPGSYLKLKKRWKDGGVLFFLQHRNRNR